MVILYDFCTMIQRHSAFIIAYRFRMLYNIIICVICRKNLVRHRKQIMLFTSWLNTVTILTGFVQTFHFWLLLHTESESSKYTIIWQYNSGTNFLGRHWFTFTLHVLQWKLRTFNLQKGHFKASAILCLLIWPFMNSPQVVLDHLSSFPHCQ